MFQRIQINPKVLFFALALALIGALAYIGITASATFAEGNPFSQVRHLIPGQIHLVEPRRLPAENLGVYSDPEYTMPLGPHNSILFVGAKYFPETDPMIVVKPEKVFISNDSLSQVLTLAQPCGFIGQQGNDLKIIPLSVYNTAPILKSASASMMSSKHLQAADVQKLLPPLPTTTVSSAQVEGGLPTLLVGYIYMIVTDPDGYDRFPCFGWDAVQVHPGDKMSGMVYVDIIYPQTIPTGNLSFPILFSAIGEEMTMMTPPSTDCVSNYHPDCG